MWYSYEVYTRSLISDSLRISDTGSLHVSRLSSTVIHDDRDQLAVKALDQS